MYTYIHTYIYRVTPDVFAAAGIRTLRICTVCVATALAQDRIINVDGQGGVRGGWNKETCFPVYPNPCPVR